MRSIVLRPSIIDRFGLKDTQQINVGSLGHRMILIPEEKITRELAKEIARPFTFVITNNFNEEYPWLTQNIEFDQNETKGLTDILKSLVKMRFGVEWNGTTIIRFHDCVLLYPICDGEYLYMTEAERVKLDTFDIDSLLRKRIISTDPSILSSINGSFHNTNLDHNLVLADDSIFSYISPREISMRLLRLEFISMQTKRNGLSFIDTSNDEISEWLLAEICMVWNLKRVVTNNIQFYSQSPQNVIREVVKIKPAAQVPESLEEPEARPKRSERMQRAHSHYSNSESESLFVLQTNSAHSHYSNSESESLFVCKTNSAHSKNEILYNSDRVFEPSPQPLPYKMVDEEFRNFLLTSLKSILSGGVPIFRIPGLVAARPGERNKLQSQLTHNYELLANVNPWSRGLTGKVEADLSMILQVFSPEDLNVLLTGDTSTYPKISHSIPGEILQLEPSGEKIIKLPDDTIYSFDLTNDGEERWKRGDFLSRWAAYMLASREYTSCILGV